MTNFIIRRVFQSFLLLFFISILIYVIINLVPGGPFDMLALSNPRISQSHIDRLNALLDLDKPVLPGRYCPKIGSQEEACRLGPRPIFSLARKSSQGGLGGILDDAGLLSGVRMPLSPPFFLVLALTAFCFASAAVAAAMVAKSHEDMSNFNSFIIIPMSFLSGTFFSPDRLPEPFQSAVRVYSLTHASLILRSLSAGRAPDAGSVLILAAYSTLFFYLAGRALKRVL